jgi:PIN domain nuclease of toxin-antitoxin system
MRLLLDTQVWLWLQTEPERVPDDLRSRLADTATELLLSAASSWEIAIKYSLGKLALSSPPRDYVPSRMRSGAVSALPVSHAHSLHVATLPLHHRDPFDRLLIAQAQLEKLPLVTADKRIDRYDVDVVPAR